MKERRKKTRANTISRVGLRESLEWILTFRKWFNLLYESYCLHEYLKYSSLRRAKFRRTRFEEQKILRFELFESLQNNLKVLKYILLNESEQLWNFQKSLIVLRLA